MGKKPFVSRTEAESKEGFQQVSSDVPENRMQDTQQIATTEDANKTRPADSSFSKKKVSAKGSTLKQKEISDAISGSSGVSGMGINFAGRSVSGTGGGVLGADNSTVSADKSRSGSRVGKKLDRMATKLNYTPCDQYSLQYDESKPLADAANDDQGFNGTYRNESARSQKIAGAVPADLMYQRSVDLISKDKLYFVEGQQVFQRDIDRTDVNPSQVFNRETGDYTDVTIHSGNYLHRGMHIGLADDGSANYCYFDVDDITPAAVSADDANVASAHRLIKTNVAELDRMNMDAKAGDEKADIWTPLARAIKEPTKWSYLLSSMEGDTGAYVHLAYSKASVNMAYQLNKGTKDGLDDKLAAKEQCVGWRSAFNNSIGLNDSVTIDKKDYTGVFRAANYQLGDPSLMIDAYDSTAKYNNKADFLLQPRGYRMHLQTADNNMNPLRLPKEYANVYAASETFSTIDREYDGLLPICMTDKANLILTHNLNELCAFYKNGGQRKISNIVSSTNIVSDYAHDEVILARPYVAKNMGWSNIYIYGKQQNGSNVLYGDGLEYDSTNHVIKIDADSANRTNQKNFIILSPVTLTEEIMDENNEELYGCTLIATIDASTQNYNIKYYMPKVDSTGTNKVTASTAVLYEDTWYYVNSAPIKYAYSDLRNNYIVDVKHPLVFGILKYLKESIGSKIRSLIGREEFYVPMIFSSQYMTLAQLLICAATPWILRVRDNSFKDILYYEDNVKEYPFSKLASIKDVPFKNYNNFIFKDYDSPIESKVMDPAQAISWIMPEFFWKIADGKYVLPWYFNENDLLANGTVDDDASNMSMPSIRSGVRLSALDTFYGMKEKDIRLSLDRMTKTFLRDTDITNFYAYKYGRMTDGQILAVLDTDKKFTIGKILSCPRELGLVLDAPLGVLTPDVGGKTAGNTYLTIPLASMSADGTATSFRIKIWTNPNTLVNPTILSSDGINIVRGANYVQKWFELQASNTIDDTNIAGLVFGLGDDGAGEFVPFADLGTSNQAAVGTVISHQRALNTRIQFLPFIISPFDGHANSSMTYSPDIYDFAYYFGLCGFRASDYRESVYNREKEVINQGLLFTDDPWVISSPIVSAGAKDTGLVLSKGYEI